MPKKDKPIDAFPNAPGLSERLNLVQQESPSYKKYRGKWIFKQRFYSICSMHRNPDPNCNMCQVGSWKNYTRTWWSNKIFKYCPRLWTWWANR